MDSINTHAQATEQESMTVQSDAPWYQVNGRVTPDEYLKLLTPSWSAEMWGRYLSWLDTSDNRTVETLLPPRKYDKLCDEMEGTIFESAESGADDGVRSYVAEYIKDLTPKQRRILEMIFWEGRSERYVAKALSINQKSVNRLKKRAFSKIRQLLQRGPRLPYMRGLNSSRIKGGTDERNHLLADDHLAEAG